MKKNLILAGVMAAMICLATFLHITVGISGYIHLGDAVIYLAAALLPNPYAAAAAAVGAGLADVLVAPVWAPFTVAIKAVMVFCFTAKKDRILCRRNLLAPWFAGLVCIGGYYIDTSFSIHTSSRTFTQCLQILDGQAQPIFVSAFLFLHQ